MKWEDLRYNTMRRFFTYNEILKEMYNGFFTDFLEDLNNYKKNQKGGGKKLEIKYKGHKINFRCKLHKKELDVYLTNLAGTRNCAMITISKKLRVANISSLEIDPVKGCFDEPILNNGTTIMEATIKVLEKINKEKYEDYKIDTIELTDNSYIYCGKNNISLAELSFLQYGSTFYGRWGFYPKDKDNREDYKKSQEKIFKFKVEDINFKKFLEKKYDKEVTKIIKKIEKDYEINKGELFINWFKGVSKRYLKRECYFFKKLIKYIVRRFDLNIFPREIFMREL